MLRMSAASQKHCWTVGRPNIGLLSSVCPLQLIFFFKIASFLSIQRVFELLKYPKTSISGTKMCQSVLVRNQYWLPTSPRSLNCLTVLGFFSAQLGDFHYFWQKSTQSWKILSVRLLDKNWATFEVTWLKGHFTTIWYSEVLATLAGWLNRKL